MIGRYETLRINARNELKQIYSKTRKKIIRSFLLFFSVIVSTNVIAGIITGNYILHSLLAISFSSLCALSTLTSINKCKNRTSKAINEFDKEYEEFGKEILELESNDLSIVTNYYGLKSAIEIIKNNEVKE